MTNLFTKALLIAVVAVLGACTNPDRYGAGGGAAGVGAAGLGSASDPGSVAYFNQTIGDRVLFAVDQSTITAEGQVVLSGQARWMNQNTQYSAILEGHADEQGTREYNLALGERRANAVREFLISQGVAGNRLRTISYGKERPLEICSVEACYSKNRRAVTVLSAGAGV